MPAEIVYGVIELAYDKKLILPLDDALDVLKIICRGEILVTAYNTPDVFKSIDPELKFSFMDEQTYKEKKMGSVLDGET